MRLQHTLLLLLTRDQEEQHSPATLLLCCANYRLEEDLIEFTCATRGSGGGEGTRGRLFSWKLLLSLSEHYSLGCRHSRQLLHNAQLEPLCLVVVVVEEGERESGRLTAVESVLSQCSKAHSNVSIYISELLIYRHVLLQQQMQQLYDCR